MASSITSRSAESRLRKAEEYRQKYVAELVEIEVEKRIGEITARIQRPHLTDARVVARIVRAINTRLRRENSQAKSSTVRVETFREVLKLIGNVSREEWPGMVNDVKDACDERDGRDGGAA